MKKFWKTGGALLAALSLMAQAGPVQGSGVSQFSQYQPVYIESAGYWQLVVYRYSTGASSASSVYSGNRDLAYVSLPGEWFGVFLYDYTFGAFTQLQSHRTDILR